MKHNGHASEVKHAVPAVDRRQSCRYSLLKSEARLGWLVRDSNQPDSSRLSDSQRAALHSHHDVQVQAVSAAGLRYDELSPSIRAALAAAHAEPLRKEPVDLRPTRVLLIDLSHSGFSALCDAPLEPSDHCRIRLESQDSGDWLDVELVAARYTKRGPHFARFSFTASCPYDIFKSAVVEVDKPRLA